MGVVIYLAIRHLPSLSFRRTNNSSKAEGLASPVARVTVVPVELVRTRAHIGDMIVTALTLCVISNRTALNRFSYVVRKAGAPAAGGMNGALSSPPSLYIASTAPMLRSRSALKYAIGRALTASFSSGELETEEGCILGLVCVAAREVIATPAMPMAKTRKRNVGLRGNRCFIRPLGLLME